MALRSDKEEKTSTATEKRAQLGGTAACSFSTAHQSKSPLAAASSSNFRTPSTAEPEEPTAGSPLGPGLSWEIRHDQIVLKTQMSIVIPGQAEILAKAQYTFE